jgi:lipopolysaccharide heptosyltransferase I
VSGHPDVDEVIVADTRGWRRRRRVAVREAWRLARTLRGCRFDVAVDLQGLLKSGIITALTRAPRRIGFTARASREWPSAVATNVRVRPPAGAHVVEQYLSLLAPLGIVDPAVEFRLPVDPVAAAYVDRFLGQAGIGAHDAVALVNPGAGRADKRWPRERFGELARRLGAEAGARVVVVWGPGEEHDADAIAADGGATRAPSTTLREMAALARRARLMIAADTGPLHIAAALGTPCVGLFGPTSGLRNGPYGPDHRVLQGAGGRVAAISVDTVVETATGLLARVA